MNFCQIFPVCYNRHLSRCPFLSFLSNLWQLLAKFAIFAKFVNVLKINNQHAPFCHLIWIFSQTLDEFLAHSSYLSKFSFCQYSPLCHLILSFARSRMDSCSIPHFPKFAIFVKIANCPTQTVAGIFELYEQLLPTRLFACQKNAHGYDGWGDVQAIMSHNELLRLCNKAPESVAHVLAGQSCS